MPEECPAVCKLALKNLGDDIVELKEKKEIQWEEIAKRAKLGPLLWFAGITVIVLGGLLGAIYTQGQETHKDLILLKVKQAEISILLNNYERLRTRSNRATNPGDNKARR